MQVVKWFHIYGKQYIPYSLTCDLLSRNLEIYWDTGIYDTDMSYYAITFTRNNMFHIRLRKNLRIYLDTGIYDTDASY